MLTFSLDLSVPTLRDGSTVSGLRYDMIYCRQSEKDTQTDRQTERHTDRQTERHVPIDATATATADDDDDDG